MSSYLEITSTDGVTLVEVSETMELGSLDAKDFKYEPANPDDWEQVPDNPSDALDELASRASEDFVYQNPVDGRTWGRKDEDWSVIEMASNLDSFVYNTNRIAYADGEQGLEDPQGLSGWFYENTDGGKINWYFYGSNSQDAPTFEEFGGCYFVVDVKKTGAQLFVTVYTQSDDGALTGYDEVTYGAGGQTRSWYGTRWNYDDYPAFQALSIGQYLVHTEGMDVRSVFPELPRLELPLESFAGSGNPQERLMLIGLQTGSGLPERTNVVTVSNFSYMLKGYTTKLDLHVIPTNAIADPPNFNRRVDFQNVDSVQIPYGSFPIRPLVEVWVRDGLGFVQAETNVTYDTSNKTITVSFGGSFETGYIILR